MRPLVEPFVTRRPPRASARSDRSSVAVPTLSITHVDAPARRSPRASASSNGPCESTTASAPFAEAQVPRVLRGGRRPQPGAGRPRHEERGGRAAPADADHQDVLAVRHAGAAEHPHRARRHEPERARLLPRQELRLRRRRSSPARPRGRRGCPTGVRRPPGTARSTGTSPARHSRHRPHDTAGSTTTSAPDLRSSTAWPTSATTPAPSAPTTCGNPGGAGMPRATHRSRWFRPLARSVHPHVPRPELGLGHVAERRDGVLARSRPAPRPASSGEPIGRMAGWASCRPGAGMKKQVYAAAVGLVQVLATLVVGEPPRQLLVCDPDQVIEVERPHTDQAVGARPTRAALPSGLNAMPVTRYA